MRATRAAGSKSSGHSSWRKEGDPTRAALRREGGLVPGPPFLVYCRAVLFRKSTEIFADKLSGYSETVAFLSCVLLSWRLKLD
jgi:hypothetical protein